MHSLSNSLILYLSIHNGKLTVPRNTTAPSEAAASCDPKAASQSAVVAILSGELREVADEAKSEDQLK